MVPIRNALAGCVVALLLVTGCTSTPAPVQPSLPTPAPAADTPAPPPELKDGLHWKQVGFRLEQGGDCLGATAYTDCWAPS